MMESGIMRDIGMEAADGASTIIIGIIATTVTGIMTVMITTGTIITTEMSTVIITTTTAIATANRYARVT
jgi:hypothetical protein